MREGRFLQGFAAATFALGLVLSALDILFVRVGELDLDHIVERQLVAPNGAVLFSSGINQHALEYKLLLLDRLRPEIVAIGSSRAMELRSSFFRRSFLSLGGATSNVSELEIVIDHIVREPVVPTLAVVMVDPWWFNSRYAGNRSGHEGTEIPNILSADLLIESLRAFHHGNWVARSHTSRNLGIFALLEDEGFAKDGSYYYAGTISGHHPSTDVHFAGTFARIDEDRDRFEKNLHASIALVQRGCKALNELRQRVGHVVLIAPPFAKPVWRHMSEGGYQYIAEAYDELKRCTVGIPFFMFTDQATIQGSTDCEFIDGLHGGDVTYARMLKQVGHADPIVMSQLDHQFLNGFIQRFAGLAGGATMLERPGMREVDFLDIGCAKPNPLKSR